MTYFIKCEEDLTSFEFMCFSEIFLNVFNF